MERLDVTVEKSGPGAFTDGVAMHLPRDLAVCKCYIISIGSLDPMDLSVRTAVAC